MEFDSEMDEWTNYYFISYNYQITLPKPQPVLFSKVLINKVSACLFSEENKKIKKENCWFQLYKLTDVVVPWKCNVILLIKRHIQTHKKQNNVHKRKFKVVSMNNPDDLIRNTNISWYLLWFTNTKKYSNIILLLANKPTNLWKTLEEFQMTGICPSFYFIFCAQKYLQKWLK